jgi:hypothetical protein
MTTRTASSGRASAIGKVRLATEIVRAYARVRWSLWRGSLPATVETLRGSSRRAGRSVDVDVEREGPRLGRAVVRTMDALPSGSRCLMRSLVLLELLSRRGVDSDLVIAVQPSEQLTLDAHAWIEVDGQPLLAPAPDYGRLVTL